jgi:hypothetical protein
MGGLEKEFIPHTLFLSFLKENYLLYNFILKKLLCFVNNILLTNELILFINLSVCVIDLDIRTRGGFFSSFNAKVQCKIVPRVCLYINITQFQLKSTSCC